MQFEERDKRDVIEAKKYFDFAISQLEIENLTVADPRKIAGECTLAEWDTWAEKRYNWGAVADDDVAKSARQAMKRIYLWALNLKDSFKTAFKKTMDVAENRGKMLMELKKQIVEADKMAKDDETKLAEVSEQLNLLQVEVDKLKHRENYDVEVKKIIDEEMQEMWNRVNFRVNDIPIKLEIETAKEKPEKKKEKKEKREIIPEIPIDDV